MDWLVVLMWLALMSIGLMGIYAVGYSDEHVRFFDPASRSSAQAMWVGVAFLIAFLVMLVEGRFYHFFAEALYALSLLLMVATLLFGREINGSKSWLALGPLSVQSVEFMKVATALMLAKVMGAHEFRLQNVRDIVRAALVVAAPVGLALGQHDMGSSLVFVALIVVLYRAGLRTWIVLSGLFFVFLFILSLLVAQEAIIIFLGLVFVGIFMIVSQRYRYGLIAIGIIAVSTVALYFGPQLFDVHLSLFEALLIAHAAMLPVAAVYAWWSRLHYIFLVVGFFVAAVGTCYSVDYVFDNVLKEHQRRRINDLLGIESDIKGWGYNVYQSKVAIGSGGFTGKGFLEGTQTKGSFVPEQSTDFIFCTLGEEWGFVGALVVLALYLLLLARLVGIAERQKSTFAKLYGYGVAAILFFHFAVNIGMTIGVMPVVGIPLPFISYGGSSLWAFTILIFVLLKLDVAQYDQQQ
ncbi:MAG: rod shape-determining protein RodA [Prevotellaceae bacterium]|jgi:rod shape determining protein RodA|nr:rod shape-determining protein RodA [Prevotellaceae bacterium]